MWLIEIRSLFACNYDFLPLFPAYSIEGEALSEPSAHPTRNPLAMSSPARGPNNTRVTLHNLTDSTLATDNRRCSPPPSPSIANVYLEKPPGLASTRESSLESPRVTVKKIESMEEEFSKIKQHLLRDLNDDNEEILSPPNLLEVTSKNERTTSSCNGSDEGDLMNAEAALKSSPSLEQKQYFMTRSDYSFERKPRSMDTFESIFGEKFGGLGENDKEALNEHDTKKLRNGANVHEEEFSNEKNLPAVSFLDQDPKQRHQEAFKDIEVSSHLNESRLEEQYSEQGILASRKKNGVNTMQGKFKCFPSRAYHDPRSYPRLILISSVYQ